MRAAGTRHAEVVGAGLVGLSAAALLARSGWTVTVHEQSSELREVGAGLFLFRNALDVLREADALEEVVRDGEPLALWERFDERGRVLFRREFGPAAQVGAVPVVVQRIQLHRALARSAAAAGAEIVTGSKVVASDADGEIRLADGERRTADLIVGADGVGSILRDRAGLLRAARTLGSGGARFLIDRLPTDGRGHAYESKNGARAVGVVTCGSKLYVYLESRADDPAGRWAPGDKAVWAASFPHLEPLLGRLGTEAHWAEFARVRCTAWSAGRLVLVGDAAHAMPPHLSQGACLGMANARSLVHALGKSDTIAAALSDWEEGERPVTDLTQRWATIYARINSRWPRSLLGLRSATLRAAGRSRRVGARTGAAAAHRSRFVA